MTLPVAQEPDLATFEEELRWLVNIDSGSRCVAGVNTVADWFGARYRAMGWPVEEVAAEPGRYGKSLYTWRGDRTRLDLLILCHSDTVFPEGTARERPFAVSAGRYHGPGVADMKAGCLMALHTLERLVRQGRLEGNVGVLLNGEHELSCPTVRPYLEACCRQAKVVIATEPARAQGACVRQRKGILRYTLRFHGRAAHAGVNPEAGLCAVTEMARMILRLRTLADPERGISVNPGLVSGGVSVNAIPHEAECQLDVRVTQLEDAGRVDAQIRAWAAEPAESGVRVELEGGITRPPMVPTARGDALIEAINQLAREHGIELKWAFSGGGSDASFASPHGVPALCGMGPVGGGMHTADEYVDTRDLPARLKLFDDVVAGICSGKL